MKIPHDSGSKTFSAVFMLLYTGAMTTKEQLHQLVDELEPAQIEDLLRLAVDVYDLPRQRRPRPEFIGMGASGRGDLARCPLNPRQ